MDRQTSRKSETLINGRKAKWYEIVLTLLILPLALFAVILLLIAVVFGIVIIIFGVIIFFLVLIPILFLIIIVNLFQGKYEKKNKRRQMSNVWQNNL
jgi:ABC-type bacteriocin/lantibiotic exporter with double-glycine peptidase domain